MFKYKAQSCAVRPDKVALFYFIFIIPCAGERYPIGCCVQRWHRHRLVLSQRRIPLSNEGKFGGNQMESVQTRRFCFQFGKKRCEFVVRFACSVSFFGDGKKVVNVSTSLSFFSIFLISDFSDREDVAVVEYASERRRHKGKSFSHIGTRCAHFESRVDF